MRIVTEDPTATGGVREYTPADAAYDGERGVWRVVLAGGDGPDIERSIPRERVVYVERERDTV